MALPPPHRADDPTSVLDTRAAGGRIVRGGIVRGAGYVASTLLSLVGIILLTRYLGVAQFGRYQTVISLITVVAAVTDAGMSTLGIRDYSQLERDARDVLMRRLLGLRITLTLVGVGAAVTIALALGYDTALVLGTALAGGGLVLTVIQSTIAIPLGAGLRNEALTLIDLLRQVLTVGALALLVFAGAGIAALLGVPLVVGAALIAVTVALVRRTVPLVPAWAPRAWVGMLRQAVAFALATAVGSIYLYSSQILSSVVAGEQEAGLFAAAFRVFIVTTGIPALLVGVAFPLLSRAARDDRDRLGYALQRLFDVTSVLGIGAAVGLVLGAPFIIATMAGDDFAGSVTPLRILGVAMLASFVLAPWGFALLSLHRHREILRTNLAAFAVTVVAVITLASAFGATGAAIGATFGELTIAIGYWRGLAASDGTFRPGWTRPARAAVCALPALAVLLLSLPSWAALLLGLTVYFALLIPAGAVPDELLGALRRRRR